MHRLLRALALWVSLSEDLFLDIYMLVILRCRRGGIEIRPVLNCYDTFHCFFQLWRARANPKLQWKCEVRGLQASAKWWDLFLCFVRMSKMDTLYTRHVFKYSKILITHWSKEEKSAVIFLPLFESLSTSPFSNFQPNQRVALQQTDVKRCIRSSTDRCRRRGSQPTAWFSLLPNSACEYLFIGNRICWFILYYQREETDIIQCFPTLGPTHYLLFFYLPQSYIKILVDANNLSPAGVFPTGWLAGQVTVVVFLSVIESTAPSWTAAGHSSRPPALELYCEL